MTKCVVRYSHLKTLTKSEFTSLSLFNSDQTSIKSQKQPSFLLGLFFIPSSPTHFSPMPQREPRLTLLPRLDSVHPLGRLPSCRATFLQDFSWPLPALLTQSSPRELTSLQWYLAECRCPRLASATGFWAPQGHFRHPTKSWYERSTEKTLETSSQDKCPPS